MKGAQTVMKTNPKPSPTPPQVLRFSPTAWAKLLYLRDAGDTEIGGFGISPKEDLLFIEDIRLVPQTSTWVHVAFDDMAVADFFDAQVDAGRQPEQFARLWLHTHPGRSAEPSATDEATFSRVFGGADWAVMFILARGGQTYARLRCNVGPGAELKLPVDVDYCRPFDRSDREAWRAEYKACVRVPEFEQQPPSIKTVPTARDSERSLDFRWREDWDEYVNGEQPFEEAEYGYIRDYF
jgi:proteasome lid subunit RPN8/RPN11